MKKFLAWLLVLMMLLSMAACGTREEAEQEEQTPADNEQKPAEEQKDAESMEPAEEQKEDESAEPEDAPYLPLVKDGEEKTITIGLSQNSQTEDYETNEYTLWLEEQTGVNLEFVYFSGDSTESLTQLNMMIAGGQELPDILWGLRSVSVSQMYEFGRDGYFLDLMPYFEEYGYFFDQAIARMPDHVQRDIFAYGTDPINGALYGLPKYAELGNDGPSVFAWINHSWLDTVGLDVPTTVDELYTVLKAFAEEDPNGNGVKDELPMIGSPDMYRANITEYVINAFVYCSDMYMFNVTDGQLWLPYTTDEYRQALIYLNRLYAEGLLSPLTYSMVQDEELKNLFCPADGVSIAGVIGGHTTSHTITESENIFEYVALKPLQGETELGGYASILGDNYSYYNFITCDAEDPLLCFQFLDFMSYTTESEYFMRYGVPGRDWVWAEDGAVNSAGKPAAIEVKNSGVFTEQNNINWHVWNSGFYVPTEDGRLGTYVKGDDSWSARKSTMHRSMRVAYNEVGLPPEYINKLIYNDAENAVVAEVQTLLMDYIYERRAMFIAGTLDPSSDSDWADYLNAIEQQGASEWLAAAQSAYNRMYG